MIYERKQYRENFERKIQGRKVRGEAAETTEEKWRKGRDGRERKEVSLSS